MSLVPFRGKKREEQLQPWTPLSSLRSEMDRLFDRFMSPFGSFFGDSGALTLAFPSVDVTETESEVRVRAEVAGVDPKDIEITLSGQMLTLSGEKKEADERKGENYFFSERRFGSFRRTIELPTPVDEEKITAEHKNGVVFVTLQKDKKARAKRIQVRTLKD